MAVSALSVSTFVFFGLLFLDLAAGHFPNFSRRFFFRELEAFLGLLLQQSLLIVEIKLNTVIPTLRFHSV